LPVCPNDIWCTRRVPISSSLLHRFELARDHPWTRPMARSKCWGCEEVKRAHCDVDQRTVRSRCLPGGSLPRVSITLRPLSPPASPLSSPIYAQCDGCDRLSYPTHPPGQGFLSFSQPLSRSLLPSRCVCRSLYAQHTNRWMDLTDGWIEGGGCFGGDGTQLHM